jgi:hypothetical protein
MACEEIPVRATRPPIPGSPIGLIQAGVTNDRIAMKGQP